VNGYQRLLAELAAPRLVGSPDHTRVRAVLARELAARGYVVLEHQFALRPPGRLGGVLIAGGVLAWVSLGAALSSLAPGHPLPVAATLALLLAGLGFACARAFGGRGAPVVGLNLIGVRPRARVQVWLAAHYDSKGQPISMVVRIVAVGLAVLGLAGLATLAAGRLGGVPWSGWRAALLAAPGLVGGTLLLGNRATNGSPGAVDNASALTTVLAILDRLPPAAPVGVLFPDAEEYGLLGASALVRERANLFAGTAVLNLDGIDDLGPTRCVAHRGGPLVDAVAAALAARRFRFLPVVVDGWAFARAARECATVMRGDWRTASVVHTPRDTASRLTLSGVEQVASGVARALETAFPR
jgi:hypothetical protein